VEEETELWCLVQWSPREQFFDGERPFHQA
jgi:hypothetical protein